MRPFIPLAAAAAALVLVPGNAHGQQMTLTDNLEPDPSRAAFVQIDVRNFLRAFEMLESGGDSLAILQAEYVDRGSPGLNAFILRYELTAERLLNAIRKYPSDYAAVAEKSAVLMEQVDRYREAYAEIKRLIPDAAFPPTYFLIGAHRGIGSGSEEGPLVTIEGESIESLRGEFTPMLTHEMVHMQQVQAIGLDKYRAIFGPEKSLLALTIREGIAEYFADRVTGHMTQDEARAFVEQHESELWEQFQQEMLGTETGDWMWRRPSRPDQPPHVAYVLGARITAAYYDNAADKERAVREIMAVVDSPAFLERSGYGERVANGSR
jgi:hypothetical protein